ncbi:MAG: aldehyde dehydrogenase family protein [Gammaproteobacteria bacterium]|nr:aldehyde dehydrogenase family protein [Gammaproteobacteria bacterium]
MTMTTPPPPPPSAPLRSDFRHLIDGELVGSPLGFDVINPATGTAFARCPQATRAQLDAAIAAARRAAPAWAAWSFAERRACLLRVAEALREHVEPLADLLTREQGKPLVQARDEIGRAATQSAGMAHIEIRTDTLVDDAQRHIELGWFPLGVVGIITPWNAPINLAAGPLTAALYTGNCVVLKPSPFAPLATLKFGELLAPILPRGVANVLAGDDACGAWMCAHPGIDKISFTGSVATGKQVMASCAGTLKRVTLELGGNDAAIVLDDVDPQAIAPQLFFAAFVNSGQVCMAVKRIYAHTKVYEALCAALAAEARKARVGDGLDPATQYGPIQNQRQYRRVLDILEDTRRRGARILAGGSVPAGPGYFVPPTIVTDVPDDSRLVQEEQFGPIVPVLRFNNIDDVIRRANDTRYGLAASVWSADPQRARAIAQRLEVGTAWINQHRATAATVPFGGAKESGIGRHYSEIGLKSNMEARVISLLRG